MPSSRSVVFTPEAADDIRAILQYTRESWGDAQGQTYAATLDAAFTRLAEFPGMGKRRDEIAAGLRSHPVSEHIVYYHVSEESIIVRRVIHNRRDIEDAPGL